MVKKCERLELDISKQEKIQLLKTDVAAIKSRLLSLSRNDRLDRNVQNKNELQALINTAKVASRVHRRAPSPIPPEHAFTLSQSTFRLNYRI